MNTMPLFARWVVALLLAFPAVAGAAAPFTWQTNATTVALRQGAEVVWQFNFDNDASSKPFFHPLALPGGEPLTWARPEDHVWHYGLWFSWKYLNGVNYWEEDKQTRQSAGATSWRVTRVETRPDFSARIDLQVDYRPRNAAEPTLTERRQIVVSAPAADGSYWLDWRQDFQAGATHVTFDRTPLPGEPGGKVFGGYAGLSVRFAPGFTNTQVRATGDTGPASDHRYRFSAAAADYSGQVRGQEQGVAMLDHPDNSRHPTRWYAVVSPSQSFAFLNAAWLQLQPFELPAREKLSLRYRVIVHPERWDAERLRREHKRFAEPTASNPAPTP